jgi:hypothetical protein
LDILYLKNIKPFFFSKSPCSKNSVTHNLAHLLEIAKGLVIFEISADLIIIFNNSTLSSSEFGFIPELLVIYFCSNPPTLF